MTSRHYQRKQRAEERRMQRTKNVAYCMPPESAYDWLEHGRLYGMHHLSHAPKAIRREVAAIILERAA